MTGGDDMKFSVTEITAKPGETIHIQLKNVGTIPKMAMAHNVVVRQADDEGRGVQHRRAHAARDTDFIPAAMKAEVVASTPARRSRRNRRNHVQSPGGGGQLPLHVHLPRPLHRRHEGDPRRQVARSTGAGYSSVAGTHLA